MSQPENSVGARDDPFARALALQQRGRAVEAEAICRQLLAEGPATAAVLHLLGVIASQGGRHDQAIVRIEQALAVRSDNFRIHYNHGVALLAAGRTADAAQAYRRALELNPDHAETANNLGLALRALGRREEALELLRRAIEIRPSYPASHNNLGATLQELGRHDEAIESCKTAIGLKPDYAEAYNNIGNALRALGRLDEALVCFRKAVEIAPEFAEAHFNLGAGLRSLGRTQEAIAASRRAAELKPVAEAWNNLAVMLREASEFEQAADACRRAIALKPDFAEAHNNLGNLLHAAHRSDEAVAAYERAIALKPDFADAYANMGLALGDLGRTDEAIAACRRGAELDPGGAQPHINLATVLEQLGRTSEAASEVELALGIDPGSAEAWFAKSDLKKFSAGDPDIETMERLLAGARSRPGGGDARMALEFALGKAWLDVGDGERAFAHLDVANGSRRAAITYDVEDDVRVFRAIAGAYTPELMARLAGAGDPSDLPIFVVGMPRSGTTLIEQILASHSEVTGAGELPAMREVVEGQPDPDGRLRWRPDFVSGLDAAELARLGGAYLERVRPLAAGKRRLVDKMPGNFRHAGLIHLMLPNARIVHCRRDPVDTCLSCYAKSFMGRQDFSYDLRELGIRYRAYEGLMAHWRRLLPADRLIEVDYEEVVSDLEGQTRRLLELCGLGFEAACLNFHETRRQVRTASVNQVRQPLYQTSVGRWKPFERQLGPLIEALGPRGDRAAADELCALALAEQRSGRLAEAEQLYRRALNADPGHAESLHQLGVIAVLAGRPAEAIDLIGRSLALAPESAFAQYDQGVALASVGRDEEAAAAFTRAIELKPDYVEAHNNLAVRLLAAGRCEEAAAACRRAIALRPDFAKAHSNLAAAMLELGHYPAAAAACARAIELEPDYAHALNNLGNVLQATQRPEEAVAAYERAIAARPDYADAWSNMGLALKGLGRSDEAIAACRRAAALDPTQAKPHVNLSAALEEAGRTAEAVLEVERALAIDPGSGEAWVAKSDLKKFSAGDPDLDAMERLLAGGGARRVGRHDRLPLEFALGKAWMDVGDGGRAFVHLHAGNRLKRSAIAYNVEDDVRLFAAVARAYTPELMGRLAGAGNGSDLPIFVVGMPRSGSTLVEQVLASHSEVHGAGELTAMRVAVEAEMRGGAIEWLPRFVAGLTADELDRLGRAYLEQVQPLAAGKRRLVDKMLGNFGRAGLIHLMLPNARIIHCRRDPIDTCLSCYSRNFAGRLDFTYDLKELGVRYRAYEALMAHWRSLLPADRFVEVEYEAVVDDLEGQTRRLLDFCGLDFEEACLSFHETRRPVRTSSLNQVRQPLYRTSVGRWKPFERQLAPLIEALGRRRGEPTEAGELYAQALAQQRSKRFAEAEALYRRALEIDPRHAESLHQLGVIAVLSQRREEAIELIGRSLELEPGSAVAHYDLGVAFIEAGRHEQAAAAFARAAELKPGFAAAHFNLGNALEKLGRSEEAIAAHRRVTELEPRFAAAHFNLGNELLACGRHQEAVAALRGAVELQPAFFDAHNNLGNALRALDRNAEAADAYRRALALKPDFFEAHSNLGNALRDLGREEEAVAACRRALELKPDLPEAYVNLASALQGLGRTAEALEAVDRALDADPGSTLAWKIKSDLKTFAPGDPDIDRMEALLATGQSARMSLEDRLNLEFCLGKAWMDAKDGARAFAHLDAGNRLKRATYAYDVEVEARHFDALARSFTPERMARLGGAGEASELPVFVVGMPRSGTTLVEQILASHSEVHGAGELTTMREVLAVDAERRAGEVDFTREEIGALGRAYLERVLPLAAGKRRLVDKMPGNARLAGLIHLMLPNARIIHCRRDPIDTCLSCYTKNFVRGQDFSYDLEELGAFYRVHERLMAHWRGLLPAERFIEVDYERLVDDLEGQARRLVAFCGLDWQDACLDFHLTRRPVRTASVNQVRKPIYRSSVGRWKPYASQLRPLIDALGLQGA